MTLVPRIQSYRFLSIAATFALCACASSLQPIGEKVPIPHFVVGDHWDYRVVDGLRRNSVGDLDVRVIAMNAGVATMRVIYVNEFGTTEKTQEIDAEGRLRAGSFHNGPYRIFPEALNLFDFPIGRQSYWHQTVDTFRPDTLLTDNIQVFGYVQGRVPVTVPAGTYDAVAIYRIVQPDDDQFWRSKTLRRDTIRYAPEVKGVVREIRDAQYVEIGSGPDFATIRTEYTTTELVSFTPGN